jgi:hypothetical protein
MRTLLTHRRRSGFALIITLTLLALLVLAVVALSALTKVNFQIASSSLQQTQARQNALLGLGMGLSDLQRHAGDDARITGMAGIAGILAGPSSTTRYWCGVWKNDGTFIKWLTSGAISSIDAGANPIELISTGSVGVAGSTSANVEKEHVIAGRLPIVVSETASSPGVPATMGSYAYLVIDEGTKIGAFAPPDQLALPGVSPVISPGMLNNQLKLKTVLSSFSGKLPTVISYDQLSLLPTPPAASQLTSSVLQDCFHYVTLTPRMVSEDSYRTGTININTASTLVWRCLLDTYNSMPGVPQVVAVTTKGNTIGNGFAATTAGKTANSPFTTVADFGVYLTTVFPMNGSPTGPEIMNSIGPLLTVRSDTFRIRAYGEAFNPADTTKVEATAYCEAIVQRTPDPAPNGLGRRFVITYFRWLGPNDI